MLAIRKGQRVCRARPMEFEMWEGKRPVDEAAAAVVDYLADLRRGLPWLAVYLLACLGIALAYVETTPSDYVASTRVLLEPRREVLVGPQEERIVAESKLRGEQAQTDLDLILSRDLLRSVFDAQGLSSTLELLDGRDGVWASVYHLAHRFAAQDEAESLPDQTFERFRGRVRARLIADSAVVEIAYRSREAAAAARIVDGIVAAFVRSRIEVSLAALRVAGAARMRDSLFLEGERRAASAAVSVGEVPRSDVQEADVRPLGSAILPIGRSFPRGGPDLAFAAVFAAISGLLLMSVLNGRDRRIDTRNQIRRRLSVSCLGATGGRPSGGEMRRQPALGRERGSLPDADKWRATKSAVLRRNDVGHTPTVAFVTWGRTGAGARAARCFAQTWKAGGEPSPIIDIEGREGPVVIDVERAVLAAARDLQRTAGSGAVILALPSLDEAGAGALALLPLATAVFLVVDAGSNTGREIRTALNLLRRAGDAFGGVVFQEA